MPRYASAMEAHDCPVCWKEKPLVCILPCMHNCCAECVQKIVRRDYKCPMCRAPMVASSPAASQISKASCVAVSANASGFGLRMENHCMGDNTPCVKIVRVSGPARRAGLKVTDTIIGINESIPVADANVLSRFLQTQCTVQLSILRVEPAIGKRWPLFFKWLKRRHVKVPSS